MLRGALTLLIPRLPCPSLPRSGICRCKMSEKASPICSRFIPLGNNDIIGQSSFDGSRFRLVSYNILAQVFNTTKWSANFLDPLNEVNMVYVKSSLFPHSPSPCLRWKTRSQAILTALKSFEADFLCLQELDEFDRFYRGNMETHGYLSVYIQRTGQKRDGCGILYKSGSAELVLKEEIEYNDLVDTIEDGGTVYENGNTNGLKANLSKEVTEKGISKIGLDDRGDPNDPRVRLKRDCVGILAAFKLKHPPHQLVIVANTHIYWDPEWADVKLAQVEYLLLRLDRFKEEVSKKYNRNPPIIVAGDFNSTPGDKVYQYLTSGNTSGRQATEPGHQIPLCSLYASIGGEPPFTNCTPEFTGTLDYIFFSNTGKLKPVSFLEIPGPGSPDVAGGLPNYHHPSDHLPIGGDFELFSL